MINSHFLRIILIAGQVTAMSDVAMDTTPLMTDQAPPDILMMSDDAGKAVGSNAAAVTVAAAPNPSQALPPTGGVAQQQQGQPLTGGGKQSAELASRGVGSSGGGSGDVAMPPPPPQVPVGNVLGMEPALPEESLPGAASQLHSPPRNGANLVSLNNFSCLDRMFGMKLVK